jgi:UDP-glucose 4-epimerase
VAVLITGGAGSHLVLGFLDVGEKVVVLDNLATGFKWAVAQQAVFVEGNVGDYDLVRKLIRTHSIDSVIHCAGSIDVAQSVRDPLQYYKNNTINSCTLIDCCIATAVPHFIFSSTAAVYGVPKNIPVKEQAPLLPISPYGSSKLLTEKILRDAALAHPLNYVVLRYFNVAGADPKGRAGQSTRNATHLVKVAVEVASGARSHLKVYGSDYPTPDGTCIRDYVHVTDLVSAHLAALTYLRDGGQSCCLNCGYGHGASVFEVIAAVERAANKKISVRLGERRSGDVPALVANADRIRTALRWQPRYDDLETIVEDALCWQRRLPRSR